MKTTWLSNNLLEGQCRDYFGQIFVDKVLIQCLHIIYEIHI